MGHWIRDLAFFDRDFKWRSLMFNQTIWPDWSCLMVMVCLDLLSKNSLLQLDICCNSNLLALSILVNTDDWLDQGKRGNRVPGVNINWLISGHSELTLPNLESYWSWVIILSSVSLLMLKKNNLTRLSMLAWFILAVGPAQLMLINKIKLSGKRCQPACSYLWF